MPSDRSSEETTVVAAYPTRHDAEMACSILEDRGIRAFVAADDVHPPLQMTEGARLLVMTHEAWEAHEVLEEAGMLPSSGETDSDEEPETGFSRPIGLTAWLYILGFVLVLIVLAIGVFM